MGYLLIITLVFITDLIVKTVIEKTRSQGKQNRYFKGKVIIQKYYNKGFALDKFEKYPRLVSYGSAAVTVVLLIKLIILLFQKGYKGLKVALSLIIGGACSNIFDRFTKHYVVDYISFDVKWKKLRQVVFNLSDFCIIAGTLLMMISKKPGAEKKEKSAQK